MIVTGLVCRYKPLFESYWQVMLFSPEHGRFYCLHRRSSRRTARADALGHFQPTTIITATVKQGRQFSYISQVETTQLFHRISTTYQRFDLAMYCLITVIKITVLNQPNPELYRVVTSTLTALDDPVVDDIIALRTAFNYAVLQAEGLPISSEIAYDDQVAAYSGLVHKKLNKNRNIDAL